MFTLTYIQVVSTCVAKSVAVTNTCYYISVYIAPVCYGTLK